MEEPPGMEDLTQKLQRDVNCLSDESRSTRRRALERLRRETVAHSPPLPAPTLQALLELLLKPLLKLFSDPVEKCRELAIAIFTDLSGAVVDVCPFLPVLMPVLVVRLGSQEVVEPSEELRLSLVALLSALVQQCTDRIAPYVSDMVAILQRTIVDPFPEVKKESCVCSTKLAAAVPSVFSQQSESLAKPLLQSVQHQHSKVRVACLQALGSTILHGSATPITDALPQLAQRACDPTPSVRLCLAEIVGCWLLELPDRYSYFHKLLPLLLTCVTDELPDIRTKAHRLWEQVGAQYEVENEEELKDKLDFTQHCDPAPQQEFPRPRLGCRVLVYRNFSKILPAILRDIVDWTLNSRIKSSQLLHTLLYNLESHATHHIQALLAGLYKGCQDDEPLVRNKVEGCGELLGWYIGAEVWSRLVLAAVRTSSGGGASEGEGGGSSVAVGPVQCTSCLMTLAALIRGARPNQLKPFLPAVAECLSAVGQSQHPPLLYRLLCCVEATIQAAAREEEEEEHCCSPAALSLPLFTVLLRVAASTHTDNTLAAKVEEVMLLLATAQGMGSSLELYQAHAGDVLSALKHGHETWTVSSPDCDLFASLLSGAGLVIGQLLDDVIPILTSCLRPDGDPEMKLRFITLLIRLLLEASSTVDSQQQFSAFASRVVTDIVLPNCVWRGGRTSAAIRTAALSCLQAMLQRRLLVGAGQLTLLLPELLPQVVSSLDDDNQSTRLVSCKVLQLLLLERPAGLEVSRLHPLYADLLKRMDDSSDEIRVATAHTFIAFVDAFPEQYDQQLYRAHTEALYKGLLIHLDDPSPEIQDAVCEVLKRSSRLNKDLLRALIDSTKHKHRSTRYCDDLEQYLNSQHC